ncbi:BNI4-like protein [Elsinoe fawcettii]|nr:BNI4-like protein [Elsinoe fawcettii]
MRAPLQSLQNTSFHHDRPDPPTTPSPKKRRQMAEVMLVQPSSSMSMLQPRSNTSDGYQSPTSSQSYQQTQRHSQGPRTSYTTSQNVSAGQHRATAAAPVQPYAFQSTPTLQSRTNSAPVTHTRSSSTSDKPSTTRRMVSKEDLARPQSVINLSSSIPDLSLGSFDSTQKASPDRYRRASSKKADTSGAVTLSHASTAIPSGSGMSSVEHLYIPPPVPPMVQRAASDDAQTSKSPEAAKRYRRRSTATIETVAAPAPSYAQVVQRPSSSHAEGKSASTIRPVSSHHRKPSSEKSSSGSVEEPVKAGPPSPVRGLRKETSPVRAPARGSSEANKRLNHPSPLSRSAFSTEGTEEKKAPASPPKSPSKPSPAAQQLAALSDKDLNKGMKSRLRRAFSFGSAAELRKAQASRTTENAPPIHHNTPGQQHQELDEEQMEIARRQTEAGLGAGIYSGQGGFAGSTDNISISSTASSASVMLRKMGTSMKKGGRSLKGLFRPKSVIGVPAADGPIQPSLAEVSMVTVEAERQRVNVNAHVSDQTAGGTGFPKLERNSMEIPAPALEPRGSAERNDSLRKSIVGSDKERAEVLAAVKKGILKRNGTGSPTGSPTIRAQNAPFTEGPRTASPTGSIPGTPKDERKSRSLSSTNSSNNDYFSPRLNVNTRSMPATPQSSRNISFSPRIQFHDAWSSTEYDRRGEIATCNRLTPMLAQQIKEELNTFKMEMEVHELSKPHTHFF